MALAIDRGSGLAVIVVLSYLVSQIKRCVLGCLHGECEQLFLQGHP